MPDKDATDKARRWFDQFKPDPKFEHPQWCFRHWAPAVDLEANGTMASILVLTRILEWSATVGNGAAEETAAIIGERGKLCCLLGDDLMFEIWGKCGPMTQPPDMTPLS